MKIDFSQSTFLAHSAKYNYPEGRYNYYPRLTSWNNSVNDQTWLKEIKSLESKEIDLYIHIPFCTKFCFFCGCNVKASTSQELYNEYIEKLEIEWGNYKQLGLKVKNVYFGGGTPNSLNIEQIGKILNFFSPGFDIHLEYDPRFHNFELLLFLKERGLKTLSMGIQDLKTQVLQSIGRPSQLDEINSALTDIGKLALEYVNIDIIYGLPNQDENSVELLNEFLTKHTCITGVSLFPFAEVPWFKEYNPNFRKDLIKENFKSLLHFEFSKVFLENHFELISFGHYARENSTYQIQFKQNKLQRNIMGFCQNKSQTIIGIGVSAISTTPNLMKQNHKIFENYIKWPTTIYTSHTRNASEKTKENIFLALSTKNELDFEESGAVKDLVEMGHLIKNSKNTYTFSTLGRHFIQYNVQPVCSSFHMTEN